jgi:energy-coupling factor transport system ATP-binding protein
VTVRIEGLSFTYPGGAQALRQVSLDVPSGGQVALVGENGAGKTTLAKVICGLLRPDAGRVWVGDWDAREHSAAQLARRVTYVFQNPDDQLFERTVQAEVAFGPRNLGLPSAEIENRVTKSLETLQLEGLRSRHPYELTPTQRKFVALAAADAMQAPFIILDEPTTGLDGPGLHVLDEYLARKRLEGTTILAISHDMDFVAEQFERVVVMSGGEVLADASAAQVFGAAELLAASHLESPQIVRLAERLGWRTHPLTVEAFVAELMARPSAEVVR